MISGAERGPLETAFVFLLLGWGMKTSKESIMWEITEPMRHGRGARREYGWGEKANGQQPWGKDRQITE